MTLTVLTENHYFLKHCARIMAARNDLNVIVLLLLILQTLVFMF